MKRASDARGGRRRSLRGRLLALAVLPSLLSVMLVGGALTTCQTRASGERLRAKVDRYAVLAAEQVRSAVAFDDKETAREVFDALARDADVLGLALFDERDKLIYGRGQRIELAEVRGATAPTPYGGELVQVAPVVSVEGPRGTLAIVVSRSYLATTRARNIAIALAVGLVAAFGAIAVATVVARRLSRRIREIAGVAERIAEGDLDVASLAPRGDDELGRTANAVNAMVARLRAANAVETDRAATEKARLEAMVDERTAQLEARNRALRVVLDHVNQGLLTIGLDGAIAPERSRAVDELLGPIADGEKLPDVVCRAAPRTGPWFAAMFEQLSQSPLPLEIALAQLPTELVVGARVLALAFTPIGADHGEATGGDDAVELLVTITDVTAERAREVARAAEAELAVLFRAHTSDRHGLARFFEDADDQIRTIRGSQSTAAVKAALHTLKGNAALLGLQAWAARCHAAEDKLQEEGELGDDARRDLTAEWAATQARIAPLLAPRGTVEIATGDYRELLELARLESGWAELRALLRTAMWEPVAGPMRQLATHCEQLADRTGRGPIRITIEDAGIRLDPKRWNPVWAVLTHVARNAVIHGFAPGAERTTPAEIALRARRTEAGVLLEIADNGGGIDWSALAAAAHARGMPATERRELIAAMFASGVSTQQEVDAHAGRGVGLAAVALECKRRGVFIDVTSELGQGTTFRFELPLVDRTIRVRRIDVAEFPEARTR